LDALAVEYDIRRLVTDGALVTQSFVDFLELFTTPVEEADVEMSEHRRRKSRLDQPAAQSSGGGIESSARVPLAAASA
jgi:hypothetical protein